MSIKSAAFCLAFAACVALPLTQAQAASLQVSPVIVEVAAPGAAASLNLRNQGDKPLEGQVRVFRWTQVDGEDKLVPTDDVVASPPQLSMRPNANYIVRVVRTTKTPVTAEETYRLLIDELPGPAAERRATVNMVLRYSVPVFFTAQGAAPGKLHWELQRKSNKLSLVARNDGDRRVRISNLKITDSKGATAAFGAGLNGYVLGHGAKTWPVPASAKGFGALAAITAESDAGPINARP